MRIVLDTNVLVSALLSPSGPPASILRGILSGQLGLLVTDAILQEYTDVLGRPKFGFDPHDAALLLSVLAELAEPISDVGHGPALPDPEDGKILACAAAGRADCLVTGNTRHFPSRLRRGVRVCTPREFLRTCHEMLP